MVVLRHKILEWFITANRYLGLLFRRVTPNLEIRKKVTMCPFCVVTRTSSKDNLKFSGR